MGKNDNTFEFARKLLSERRRRFSFLREIGRMEKLSRSTELSLSSERGGQVASLILLLVTLCRVEGLAEQTNHPGHLKFQSALQSQMSTASELPKANPAEDTTEYSWRIMVALALCGACGLPLVVPRAMKLLNERVKAAAAAAASAPGELHKAFVESQLISQIATQVQSRPEADPAAAKEAQRDALEEFFQTAPDLLGTLRNLFAGISRSPEPAARKKSLEGLNADVETLKARLAAFDLIPAWQVACGLEKLLAQLAEKPANITPSALRTAAAALVLLEDLCVPDIRTDLGNNPAVHFLAVDDDPISRRAVSMSLKKVAQAPDLAEHGEAALELAAKQSYDAVFLDVEMPGLDGFEVCTKLHELPANRTTPVVFVTSHSDFESRAKSTSSGGRDLIAKPFLSSEITLKALTLLLRSRLERHKTSPESQKEAVLTPVRISPSAAKPHTKAREISLAIVEKNPVQTAKAAVAPLLPAISSPTKDEKKLPAAGATPSELILPTAKDHAEAFAAHGVEHLREMQKQVAAVGAVETVAERQELLGELYVGLNMLRSEAARAGLKGICELASGLGKLIAKLLDKPNLLTPSALQAMSAAITFLEELASSGSEHNLTEPPIRVLVVDDDPLARRAISNALQLTFGKPDNAEDGKAALALTESKVFDVIFLDIMMPEMDGFETCAKIRETRLNAQTPIVFVSSRQETEAQEKSAVCGGNGFITKPVLPAEIFLTAQTFGKRARMNANGGTATASPAVCVPATPAPPAEKFEEAIC
jgi:DNA-binding response OmpR family regulator